MVPSHKSNITISIFILRSIFVFNKEQKQFTLNKLKLITTIFFVSIFSILAFVEGSLYLNINFIKHFIHTIMSTNPIVEIIDNLLFLLSFVLLIDERTIEKKKKLTFLSASLLVLSVFQIYFASPGYFISIYRIYIHCSKVLGLILLCLGLKEFEHLNLGLSFRKKLLTYISLLIISFNFIFLFLWNFLFKMEIPYLMQYIFLLIFILTIFFHYIFSSKLLSPITNLMSIIDSLKPKDEYINIDTDFNDEIGLLVHKINNFRKSSWSYTQDLIKKQNLIRQAIKAEKSRRELIEHVSEFIEFNELKQALVQKIGQTFDTDRCYIRFFDNNSKKFLKVDEYSEFLKNSNVKSIVGTEYHHENIDKIISVFKKNKIIVLNNSEDINLSKAASSFKHNLINSYDMHSAYFFPVFFNNELIASISLQYTSNHKSLNINEINVLKGVCSHFGFIIKNSELFMQIKQQAKKEKLLRTISDILKSEDDSDEKIFLVNSELSRFFNAEQVLLIEANSIFSGPKYVKEFRANTSIISFEKRKFCENCRQYWHDLLLSIKPVLYENISNQSTIPDYFKAYYDELGVKSLAAIPFTIDKERYACIFLYFYNQESFLNNDNLSLLDSIAEQLSIFLKEAEIYSQKVFLSNISHEIKTPLAMISGFSELLSDEKNKNSTKTDEFIEAIVDNVNRVNNIINSLLYISKIEEDVERGVIDMELCPLNDIIDNILFKIGRAHV